MRLSVCCSLSLASLLWFAGPLAAQIAVAPAHAAETLRAQEHQTPEWIAFAPHLPDPATASPQQLETAADVMRARRFPEDALDFYIDALQRGGNQDILLNKIGTTELELQEIEKARAYFKRVVTLDRKSADGWNNLGAVEYLNHHPDDAIIDYKRALKLNQRSPVFHSNLGTIYMEEENFSKARKEFETAIRLDPHVFDYHGLGGTNTHVLAPEERGRYCYEMARLYALRGDSNNVLHWLAMSSEAGFDVLAVMKQDSTMAKYNNNPRLALLIKNGELLRSDAPAVLLDDSPAPPTTEKPPSEQAPQR